QTPIAATVVEDIDAAAVPARTRGVAGRVLRRFGAGWVWPARSRDTAEAHVTAEIGRVDREAQAASQSTRIPCGTGRHCRWRAVSGGDRRRADLSGVRNSAAGATAQAA